MDKNQEWRKKWEEQSLRNVLDVMDDDELRSSIFDSKLHKEISEISGELERYFIKGAVDGEPFPAWVLNQ